MNNLLMVRTRLDNRERRTRGHELIRTGPDGRTGDYGSDGVGSPVRRESVKDVGSVDGGGPSCSEQIKSSVLAGDPLAGRAAIYSPPIPLGALLP
jgi:hypothetical protein